jgi:hypothetical protein
MSGEARERIDRVGTGSSVEILGGTVDDVRLSAPAGTITLPREVYVA